MAVAIAATGMITFGTRARKARRLAGRVRRRVGVTDGLSATRKSGRQGRHRGMNSRTLRRETGAVMTTIREMVISETTREVVKLIKVSRRTSNQAVGEMRNQAVGENLMRKMARRTR